MSVVIMPSEPDKAPTTPAPNTIVDALDALHATSVAPGVWTAELSTGITIRITDPTGVDVDAAPVVSDGN